MADEPENIILQHLTAYASGAVARTQGAHRSTARFDVTRNANRIEE
jgi:hypothetical protein